MECTPITITWKQFRQLKAAVLIQHFQLGFEEVGKAMVALQCWHYRKERIKLRVLTTWYKR
jgi:hypothetical protein